MNASSKYANLPFIASGEKDVFETDDLPEADQVSQQQQPIYDASIEIIPTGSGDAFQKFAASEGIQSIKTGRTADSSESYVAKFNRIKAEIEDLQRIATSNNNEADVALDAGDLATKLASLQEIRFQSQPSTTASAIVKELKSAEKASQNEEHHSPLIKYELFCKPDKEQMLELSKINYLEQRIKKIENIVGINETPKDAAFLSSYLKDQPIMNIVIQLSNKVLQLDHSSLERVDARLHTIIEKLNQISDKKSSLDSLNTADRLNELYNYYVKTVQNRKTLPSVLERLQVLSEVQEQACQFSATLSTMKDVQHEIQTSLDKNSQHLKILKEMMETKSEEIKQVITDFNERLEKLTK